MKLSELREQVEGLEGPSREVNALICAAFGFVPEYPDSADEFEGEDGVVTGYRGGRKLWRCRPRPVTASIADALALAARMNVLEETVLYDALNAMPYDRPANWQSEFARQIIIALLRALESQEEKAA